MTLIRSILSPNRIPLLGVEVDRFSFDEALNTIANLVEQRTPSYVVTPNVDHLIQLQGNPLFRQIYREAALVLPDGVPLLWAGKYLGTPLRERITGADLFPAICRLARERGFRLFFLGGMPGVAEKAKAALEARFPGISITGTYSPPFGFEKDEAEIANICSMIRDARTDILFVGLGAPKQEKFIWKYRNELKVPVSIGVGIAFDFVAGTLPRAPEWMQKVGLEWFFRLLMDPRRLFKRYVLMDMRFFKLVYLQKVRMKTKPAA